MKDEFLTAIVGPVRIALTTNWRHAVTEKALHIRAFPTLLWLSLSSADVRNQ